MVGTPAPHITIDGNYPFTVWANTNVQGGYSESIAVECTDNTGTAYISATSSFTQTCNVLPLPNVVIPSRNYHYKDAADTVVPNALYEFFDGTSNCVLYKDWTSCNFVGSGPRHLSIVETYPFEIQADLRVIGGYTESFQIECKDRSNNTYTGVQTSFTQTCIPTPITPAVPVPSQNYNPTMTSSVIVVDPTLSFFSASECVNWASCTFTGQDPLSISDTYPFSISADLTRLGGYTRSFKVSCKDNYANPTTYTSTETTFTETCVPTPVALAIPAQNYDPKNSAAVIVANSLTEMFEASSCVNWDKCVLAGAPAHLSISSAYPYTITADLSVEGGYTTAF